MSLLLLLRRHGFQPSSLAGLKIWLDATQITGLVDADPVTTWSDRSGQGNHVTQATAAKKPTYRVAIQNGLPVVRFDGVDDYLKAVAFTLNQPEHVFLVAKLVGTPSSIDYYFDGNAGDSMAAQTGNSAAAFNLYAGASLNSGVTDLTTFHVLEALYNGASSQIWVDRTSKATGNVGAANAGGLTLGTYAGLGQYASVDMGEVVIFNRVLSAAERASVEGYLKVKWGTA